MSFDVSILIRLVDRLTGPARRVSQSYRQMQQNVTAANTGIASSTTQATSSINRMGHAAGTAQARLGRLAAQMRNLRTVGRGFSHTGGIGAFATFPIVAAVKAYGDFEDKVLDLKKVFPGTQKQFDETSNALRRLSYRIPLARNEIMKLAEEAAKSAVVRPDEVNMPQAFQNYVETAAQFAVAFGVPVDQASETLARLKSSLDLTVPELREMGDAMNHVANNSAATEAGILEIMRRNASLGKAIGGDQGILSVLTIGSAQLAAGVRQDVAATGLRTLLVRLQQAAGVQMSNKELKGMGFDNAEIKNLKKGLSTTKNALKVLGLSPEAIAKGLSEDTVGTIQNILGRIAELPAEQQGGLLAALGGMRATDALVPLVANLKLLEESLRLVNEEERHGSMQREYIERVKGLNAHLQILGNTFANLRDKALEPYMGYLKRFAIWMADVSEGREDAGWLKWAAGLAIGMTMFSAIMLPLGLLAMSIAALAPAARVLWAVAWPLRFLTRLGFAGLAGVAGGLASLGRIIPTIYRFAGALGVATAAFRLLRRVLLVGLAIEGLLLLYDNWDKLKQLAKDPIKFDVIFPDAPEWLKWLWNNSLQQMDEMDKSTDATRKRVSGWVDGAWNWLKGGDAAEPHISQTGVPEALARKTAADGQHGMPQGMTIQAKGPTVEVKQAPPNISVSVTVNAQTNADPNAIGAAAASAVSTKLRGALSDAPHSAP